MRTVIDHGGEGIILQSFGSLYMGGRSSSLLKLKVIFEFNFISAYLLCRDFKRTKMQLWLE